MSGIHEQAFISTGIKSSMKKDNWYELGDTRNHYCPECKEETVQKLVLSDPDNPDSMQLWQCDKCFEHIDFQTQRTE